MNKKHILMNPYHGYMDKNYQYSGFEVQNAEVFSDDDLLTIFGIISGGVAMENMFVLSVNEAHVFSEARLMMDSGIEYMHEAITPEMQLQIEQSVAYMQDAVPQINDAIDQGISHIKESAPDIRAQIEQSVDYVKDAAPEINEAFDQAGRHIKNAKPQIQSRVEQGVGYIKEVTPDLHARLDQSIDYVKDIKPDISDNITQGIENLKDSAPEWRENIEQGISDLKNRAPEWRDNIERGFEQFKSNAPDWQKSIEQGVTHIQETFDYMPELITDLQSKMDNQLQQLQELTSGDYTNDFVDGLQDLNQNNPIQNVYQQGGFK